MKLSNLSIFNSKTSLVRPFVVYLSIFFVLIVAVDYLFTSLIIDSNVTTNYYKLKRLVDENHTEEIPLFGSSTVLRGLLPDELGTEFYNYGITATNYQKLEPLLLTELDKYKKTPIIIEMPPPFFYDREQPNIRMEDVLPLSDQKHFHDFLVNYQFWEPWHQIKGLRYYGFYTAYLSALIDQSLPPGMHFSKGSKTVKRRIVPELFNQFVEDRENNPVAFSASQNLISRFEEIVSNTDRQIIMVVSPFHRIVYESGFDMEEYRSLFKQLEAKHTNLKGFIFDGREYSNELFLDTSHLNYWGAMKFTSELKQKLLTSGIIEPTN